MGATYQRGIHGGYRLSGKGIGKQLLRPFWRRSTASPAVRHAVQPVVSTNTAAIRAWEAFGFNRIRVVPEGFFQEGVG